MTVVVVCTVRAENTTVPSARPETERVPPFALLAPHAAVDQAVPDDGGALR